MVKHCKLCKQPLYHFSHGIDVYFEWMARDYANSTAAYKQNSHPDCYIAKKSKATQTEESPSENAA